MSGDLETLLGEHIWDRIGRNLGQYRVEYTCDCGAVFVADGHRGISGGAAHRAHLASVLADYVQGEVRRGQGEAWNEGWLVGFSNCTGTTDRARTSNPYRPCDNEFCEHDGHDSGGAGR